MAVSFSLVSSAFYLLNDISDYEADRLPEWHAAAEAALIEARMLPQGNYRMDWDDNTKQAYIQKDYLYTKAR